MRYERPRIVSRESIQALLGDSVKSDVSNDGIPSDVRRKENVVPVTWGPPKLGYAAPGIIAREAIQGLLDVVKSEQQVQ